MPQLHALTDDRYINGENYLDKIIPVLDAGIDVFQLRFKTLHKQLFYKIGKTLKPLLKERNITFIINDHVDIALGLDCDGVHLGQTDLPYPIARSLLGNKKMIGLSISSLEEFASYKDFDCHYFGVGPIFNTQTKIDAATSMGIQSLNKISSETSKPCIAIGGISTSNAKDCIIAGASGIAVCREIFFSNNPFNATNHLKDALCTR